MIKIGLTGGIGSGKTTVERMFEVLGIPVYYADDAAKRLMNTDAALREAIISVFGQQAYNQDKLDRGYLASQVFGNKEKLEQLNLLTHPATINDANKWMERQTGPYILKEAALIFESGSNLHLDKVIGVSSPLELRISRVMKRDRISREDVLARINRQMNEEEKLSRCDYVIYNDEKQSLIDQVVNLHQNLVGQTVS